MAFYCPLACADTDLSTNEHFPLHSTVFMSEHWRYHVS